MVGPILLAPRPAPWKGTMSIPLNRKRSRLEIEETTPELDDAPELPDLTDLKRTRTESELDELDVVPVDKAWSVDLKSIFSSPTLPRPVGSNLQAHDNHGAFVEGKSFYVFCVQGNYMLHYDLLCAVLSDLYKIAPSLQAAVLCRDPSTHAFSPNAPFSLPLIQAVGGSYNHFVRLGLLHPLGGGAHCLDAIVVVDARGRRRLVLPFGWGAGRHAADAGGGKMVQKTLMEKLSTCVMVLNQES